MSKRSIIVIDRNLGVVYKTPIKWADIVFEREVAWLKKFHSDRFPKLIDYDSENKTICMSYCGEPISARTCPPYWEDQVEIILGQLKHHNCAHNDITKNEILVLNGYISLVDFGWATEIGEPIPSEWPINLGMEHRIGVHKFDDAYAIKMAIAGVLNKT